MTPPAFECIKLSRGCNLITESWRRNVRSVDTMPTVLSYKRFVKENGSIKFGDARTADVVTDMVSIFFSTRSKLTCARFAKVGKLMLANDALFPF